MKINKLLNKILVFKSRSSAEIMITVAMVIAMIVVFTNISDSISKAITAKKASGMSYDTCFDNLNENEARQIYEAMSQVDRLQYRYIRTEGREFVLSENDNFALSLIGFEGKKYDEEYVLGILDKLGIADKKDSMVIALSGGQQQRVAVARAFANNPHIILADEPTGNLDSKNGEVVVKMLVEMSKEMHKTILMITHNERIAEVADVVVRIKDGKINI